MNEDQLLAQLMQKQKNEQKEEIEESRTDEIDTKKEDKKILLKNVEKEVVNLIVDNDDELYGFKIFGIFKFYLNDLKVKTVAELCGIRQQIQETQKKLTLVEDMLDASNMQNVIPLYIDYCLVGLLNNRKYLYILKPFLKKKLENLSWSNIYNIYAKLFEKTNIRFFFQLSSEMSHQSREIIR